ncbi:MAG: hypothetical protein KatS3mg059_0090 [Thermomicrobiales bacterium]|nr:MAG: hypothetical protein KatS3mg059_0090 [Thermomicrobiales bacterium]
MTQTRPMLNTVRSRAVPHLLASMLRRATPGRRTTSATLGLAMLGVTVDATIHAQALHAMWTAAALNMLREFADVPAPDAWVYPVILAVLLVTGMLAAIRARGAARRLWERSLPQRPRCSQSRQ